MTTKTQLTTRTFGWSKDPCLRRPTCIAAATPPRHIGERNVGQIEYGALTVSPDIWRPTLGDADVSVQTVELHWLNGVLFTEIVFEHWLSSSPDLTALERHWDSLYSITPRIEAAIYEHFKLAPARPSIWQTPLSSFTWDGSASEHDALVNVQLTRPGRARQPEVARIGPAIIAASWDGVVVAVQDGVDELEHIEFLVRLTCLEWAILENVKTRLYAAMSTEGIWPRSRMLETQDPDRRQHREHGPLRSLLSRLRRGRHRIGPRGRTQLAPR